jgi:hypothetical protein
MKFIWGVCALVSAILISSCSHFGTKHGKRGLASQNRVGSREVEMPSLLQNTKLIYSLLRRLASQEPSLVELKNLRNEFLNISMERVEYAAALGRLADINNTNLINQLNFCHLSSAEKVCQSRVQDIVQTDKEIFKAFETKFEAEFVKGERLLKSLDTIILDLEAEGGNANAQLGVWTKLNDTKKRLYNILSSMPLDGVNFDHAKFMIASGLDSEVNLGSGFYFNFHIDYVEFSIRELKLDSNKCKSLLKNYSEMEVLREFTDRLKIGFYKNNRTDNIDPAIAKDLSDVLSATSVPTLKCVRASSFEPSTYDFKTNTFHGAYNLNSKLNIDSWGIPSKSKSFSFSLFFSGNKMDD